MIRKLNNKGMTAVEILVTFVIIIVIVVSMYNGILDLKNKETISSYKLSLVTYNNLLTKDIQDDLINWPIYSTNQCFRWKLWLSYYYGFERWYEANFRN